MFKIHYFGNEFTNPENSNILNKSFFIVLTMSENEKEIGTVNVLNC